MFHQSLLLVSILNTISNEEVYPNSQLNIAQQIPPYFENPMTISIEMYFVNLYFDEETLSVKGNALTTLSYSAFHYCRAYPRAPINPGNCMERNRGMKFPIYHTFGNLIYRILWEAGDFLEMYDYHQINLPCFRFKDGKDIPQYHCYDNMFIPGNF